MDNCIFILLYRHRFIHNDVTHDVTTSVAHVTKPDILDALISCTLHRRLVHAKIALINVTVVTSLRQIKINHPLRNSELCLSSYITH
jgi:hypothetical protein